MIACTSVERLEIGRFRRFQDLIVPFGPHVTLIAGQNGTSKSTLLGMLAQPFSFGIRRGVSAQDPDKSSYTSNYHGLVLKNFRDLAGGEFMYDCDNVFRLSRRFDTNAQIYKYRTVLANVEAAPNSPLIGNALFTQNRVRSGGKGVRFVTGPGASHKSGEGNYPHPVMYLGLKRLWPLADTKGCKFTADSLSGSDRDWYVTTYNDVLCLEEHANTARFMDTAQKRKFVTPESGDYDGESCSAGQDNLGQILTALLSFRHLAKKLESRYRGGLLLIDEVDATLHAYAQDRLLALLCKESEELGLQVVATTHSLRTLRTAFESPLRKQTHVLYLANQDGRVALKQYRRFEEIEADLSLDPTPPSKKGPSRVSVILEDQEAKKLFHYICGSKLRNYITVENLHSIDAGNLKNLGNLSSRVPSLQNLILLADGDMAAAWENPPKNLLPLPGGKRPETLIYDHLHSLPASDPFWESCQPGYSRQVAIAKHGGKKGSADSKEWAKSWFDSQSKYWGKNNKKVFESWVDTNKLQCLEFTKAFIKLVSGRYRGKIPKDTIQRALDAYK